MARKHQCPKPSIHEVFSATQLIRREDTGNDDLSTMTEQDEDEIGLKLKKKKDKKHK